MLGCSGKRPGELCCRQGPAQFMRRALINTVKHGGGKWQSLGLDARISNECSFVCCFADPIGEEGCLGIRISQVRLFPRFFDIASSVIPLWRMRTMKRHRM
ncbi:uncharacterized protein CIMG_13534 [Coccidioides immitis RS]|uniref:Uncharacterized protein n=1 Tax=Coccidioides immitis (strain RS) TaxID=246410 RepID=A0A0D8JWD9_COCIM|nr:uncharacterized protein CIMG_13534 [Coccidioides immitis RS]KJF61246.1 hypothetical protein CIMG_13534 [Coccidioides immitis RS]